ncbi:MAG: hypothetical protein P1U85_13775 [Verrucomicrobiales bacterium]|nr:hypothetical protein [Verrucomicrobiales bacterium]
MKSFAFAILLSTFFLGSVLANPPALNAAQAATIAQEDLEARGLQDKVFIAQVIYKKGGFGSKKSWEIYWSESFPAQTEGRNEFGARVTMDGKYTRLVR